MQNFIPVLARILLSAIFLKSGVEHLLNFGGTQQILVVKGIPMSLAGVLVAGAVVALLGGGLSVLLGYKARWGAIVLILFLIPATLLFHTKFSDPMQVIQFLKNLGLSGGLLMLVQFGPGAVSLDAHTARTFRGSTRF